MLKRSIKLLKSKSFFLFGARGTGKSTLIRDQFQGKDILYLDLLDPSLEDRLARHPEDLKRLVTEQSYAWVIIDEVQKVPKLLDVVHDLIVTHQQKFILTGSSARKLKRGGANLLAGRALVFKLFPLTSFEYPIVSDEELCQVIRFGSLPEILHSTLEREKKLFLASYALTYIKEEVAAEQLLRKLEPFRNFLRIVADQSGKIVNHSAIAKQVGVDHKSVVNYYSVLEDTLLGFYLPSFHPSIRKSQLVAPKFYLFDMGVRNSLAELIDLKPVPETAFFGTLFEHWLILEVYRLNSYCDDPYRLSYLMTKSGFEVDLILSRGRKNIFIEIKSAKRVDTSKVEKIAKNLFDLKDVTEIIYVSRDKVEVSIEGVRCLHWQSFLKLYFSI